MLHRPRRLRINSRIRSIVQETQLNLSDFIYPIFVTDSASSEIKSMPGIQRLNINESLNEIESLMNQGLQNFAIFPVINPELKDSKAKEALNTNNLNFRAIKTIKSKFPETLIVSDIALDPYTDHGHDGLIKDGAIDNDTSVEILAQMSILSAEAGADIVAPSDMMDGRVRAIRESLEKNGFEHTLIMSYAAKYASSLYGPFREALGSLGSKSLSSDSIPKDKLSYQMDFHNSREALKELELDISEGADILMVKPASWYLDIIKDFKSKSKLPIAAYQVSGEYSMIKAAAQAGYIDETKAIYESLVSIKRAGADLILSYFAKDIGKVISGGQRHELPSGSD